MVPVSTCEYKGCRLRQTIPIISARNVRRVTEETRGDFMTTLLVSLAAMSGMPEHLLFTPIRRRSGGADTTSGFGEAETLHLLTAQASVVLGSNHSRKLSRMTNATSRKKD